MKDETPEAKALRQRVRRIMEMKGLDREHVATGAGMSVTKLDAKLYGKSAFSADDLYAVAAGLAVPAKVVIDPDETEQWLKDHARDLLVSGSSWNPDRLIDPLTLEPLFMLADLAAVA